MSFGLLGPNEEWALDWGVLAQFARSPNTWTVLVRLRNPLPWQGAPSLHHCDHHQVPLQGVKVPGGTYHTNSRPEPIRLKRITHFIWRLFNPLDDRLTHTKCHTAYLQGALCSSQGVLRFTASVAIRDGRSWEKRSLPQIAPHENPLSDQFLLKPRIARFQKSPWI